MPMCTEVVISRAEVHLKLILTHSMQFFGNLRMFILIYWLIVHCLLFTAVPRQLLSLTQHDPQFSSTWSAWGLEEWYSRVTSLAEWQRTRHCHQPNFFSFGVALSCFQLLWYPLAAKLNASWATSSSCCLLQKIPYSLWGSALWSSSLVS